MELQVRKSSVSMSPSSLLNMLCTVGAPEASQEKIEFGTGDGFYCVLEQNEIKYGEALRGSVFFFTDLRDMHNLSFSAEVSASVVAEVSKKRDNRISIVLVNPQGERESGLFDPRNQDSFSRRSFQDNRNLDAFSRKSFSDGRSPDNHSKNFMLTEISFNCLYSKKILFTITRETRPKLLHVVPFEISFSPKLEVPLSSEMVMFDGNDFFPRFEFEKGAAVLNAVKIVYNLKISISRVNGVAEMATHSKKFIIKKQKKEMPFFGPKMILNFEEVFKEFKPFQSFLDSFSSCCKVQDVLLPMSSNGSLRATGKRGEARFEMIHKREFSLAVILPEWDLPIPEKFSFDFYMKIQINDDCQKALLWSCPITAVKGVNKVDDYSLTSFPKVTILPLKMKNMEISYEARAVLQIKGKEFTVLSLENVDVDAIYVPKTKTMSYESCATGELSNKLPQFVELPLARIQIGEEESKND